LIMTKMQYLVVGSVLGLFLVLYLGCETKPPGQGQVEKTRILEAEVTDVNLLIRAAHDQIPPDQMSTIQAIQQELVKATQDSVRIELLKQLSGRWYDNNQPAIAGHYAQEIAELEPSEQAWSIAGTTYAICVQKSEDQKVKTFCNQRAIRAFENAISLDPNNVKNQVNLALTYTEMPPANEPMKGVMMLRELEQAFPTSTLVLNSLARLAIRTGQYEKAVQRLEQALQLEANNKNTICLLAQAYAGAGNQAQASAYEQRCRAEQ
jgi:tetratricopeptide (TPR) repeat protein